MYLMDIYF